MYRGRGANRGARRGGGGGGRWGRGGRGGNRGGGTWNHGGSRGAYRGNDILNPTASFADRDVAPTSAALKRFSKPRLAFGCYSSKQIFRYFNLSAADCRPDSVGTINSGEEKPDGASFALIYVNNQPGWMADNTIRVKSRLHLLPEYADKKALLLAGHMEPGDEELKERISATLTESIKFGRYGIEDGPDMEIFEGEDSEGEDNIAGLILPGEWMAKDHEGPEFASVDTASVKYAPAAHDPIAVFAGYGNDPDATGFKFVAWFLIEEIELFAPNSVDLARKMRDEKWAADIGREWAVVKLLRVGKNDPESRPAPRISRGGWDKAKSSEEKAREDEPKQPDDGVKDVVKGVVDDSNETTDSQGEETAAGNTKKQDSEGMVKEGQSEESEDVADTAEGAVEEATADSDKTTAPYIDEFTAVRDEVEQGTEDKVGEDQSKHLNDDAGTAEGAIEEVAADNDKTTAHHVDETVAICDRVEQGTEDKTEEAQSEKPEKGANTAECSMDQTAADSDKTTAHHVDATAAVCDEAEQGSEDKLKKDKSKRPIGSGEDAMKAAAADDDKTTAGPVDEIAVVCGQSEQVSEDQLKEDHSKQPIGCDEDGMEKAVAHDDKATVHSGKEAGDVCDGNQQDVTEEGEAKAKVAKEEDIVVAHDEVTEKDEAKVEVVKGEYALVAGEEGVEGVEEAVKDGDAKAEDAKGDETKAEVVEEVKEQAKGVKEVVKEVVKDVVKQVLKVVKVAKEETSEETSEETNEAAKETAMKGGNKEGKERAKEDETEEVNAVKENVKEVGKEE